MCVGKGGGGGVQGRELWVLVRGGEDGDGRMLGAQGWLAPGRGAVACGGDGLGQGQARRQRDAGAGPGPGRGRAWSASCAPLYPPSHLQYFSIARLRMGGEAAAQRVGKPCRQEGGGRGRAQAGGGTHPSRCPPPCPALQALPRSALLLPAPALLPPSSPHLPAHVPPLGVLGGAPHVEDALNHLRAAAASRRRRRRVTQRGTPGRRRQAGCSGAAPGHQLGPPPAHLGPLPVSSVDYGNLASGQVEVDALSA